MSEAESPPSTTAATDAAGVRIRDTAKWLTVSLAGLGAVLAAGSQLSDLGNLSPGTDRFTLAVSGGAAAVVAAAVILGLSVWVAVSPVVSFREFRAKNHSSYDSLKSNDRALGGYENAHGLDEAYSALRTARDTAKEAFDGDRTNKNKQTLLEHAQNDFRRAEVLVAGVARMASHRMLLWRWRRAGAGIILAATLGAVGIGVFAWAANPPSAVGPVAATPSMVTTTEAGELTLAEGGRLALGALLGESCAADDPLSVTILTTTDAGPDVLVVEPGCEGVRFVVVPAWGAVQG